MAVGAGKFQLYSKIDPVLSAGDYRFVASQSVVDGSTPVETLNSHVRVRAPRYQLPPDQVLSTFPPAGSEGSYGSRLPQIVIKRRTLPWERDLAGQPSATPWLALVLLAENEATLHLNQPVAECITPGRPPLAGVADTQLGSYLQVRRSVVDRVFPTQRDVPLLAHAREVDVNDTELMMGDDDGFLSVVIANRLPLAGTGPDDAEVPVKYLACLVNLEGQFDLLLPESPPPVLVTTVPVYGATQAVLTMSQYDQAQMNASVAEVQEIGLAGESSLATGGQQVEATAIASTGAAPNTAKTGWTLEQAESAASNVYADMAADFGYVVSGPTEPIDPTYRFPVLLHWSFVSSGDSTFESLMVNLDSGLMGTVPEGGEAPEGREPLEVVETGHVGLAHRTRRGDVVRSWYRGPLVPHPTPAADPGDRLPLAHVSDQLRIVIPDGREDVALASAFEVGRLLALSRPAMVAAMLRWRQSGYQIERQRSIWQDQLDFLGEIYGQADLELIGPQLGVLLGRGLARKLAGSPEEFLGGPRPLVDPGRPLELDDDPSVVVAKGFGLDEGLLGGDVGQVLGNLRGVEQPPGTGLDPKLPTAGIRDRLRRSVGVQLVDLTANSLDLRIPGLSAVETGPIVDGPIIDGPGGPGGAGGPIVDGPIVDGPIVGGPGGPVVDGPGGGIDPVIVGPTVPGTVRGPRTRSLAERLRAGPDNPADRPGEPDAEDDEEDGP